jgi:hypothetical protein
MGNSSIGQRKAKVVTDPVDWPIILLIAFFVVLAILFSLAYREYRGR